MLLIGHGSTKNSDSALSLRFQAKMLRSCAIFEEVREAFWKVEPGIDTVLASIRSENIFVVPFFLSEGYFTREVLPSFLGIHGTRGQKLGKSLLYTRPVGVHPKIDEIIDSRLMTILGCETPPIPAQTCLFVAGHGTNNNANSSRLVERQAARIAQRGQFAQVRAIFLDQSPYIKDWRELTSCKQIALLPYFLSNGLHVTEDIPELLGFADDPEVGDFNLVPEVKPSYNEQTGVVEFPPFIMKKRIFGQKALVITTVEDRRIWYTRSLGEDPMITNIILDLCQERMPD